MISAYFFLPSAYDFQQATLVEGALDSGIQVTGSTESNYCRNVREILDWSELRAYTHVFYCERTITSIMRLHGTPDHPSLIYVDGADVSEINLPPHSLRSYIFKRELSNVIAKRCTKIKGLGFGIENRYVQEFLPFQHRKYLISCMLRLDTNPFRIVLNKSVNKLKSNYALRIFSESTGEISYSATSPNPKETPIYTQTLHNSCISVSCHGAGEDTGRFWEILGAGCLLFSQRLHIATPDLPRDGEHCIYFDDEKDFLDKARYYIDHMSEAEEIAAAGHQYAQKTASTRARFQHIMNTITEGRVDLNWRDQLIIWNNNIIQKIRRRLVNISGY